MRVAFLTEKMALGYGVEVVVESVGDTEATAIERLRAGERLGKVTAELAAAGAEADAMTGLFGRWVSLGLVVSCRSSPSP